MRRITLLLAALALAGSSAAAHAQEVRASTSPAVVIASSFGGSMSGKLGLMVGSGSARDTLGLLVVGVEVDGPAEKAGIVEGDRLVAINGTPLTLSAADAGEPDMTLILRRRLERELSKVEPGEELTLRVWSGGRARDVKVRAGEERRRAVGATNVYGSFTGTRASAADRPVIGVSLGATGSKRDTLGVFVAAVEEDGPAEQAGIIEGHRIAAVNGVDVRVPAADAGDAMVASARASRLSREIEKLEPGARVQLRVWSDGRFRDVTVETKRQRDVYKDGPRVRIGGVGALDAALAPDVIVRSLPFAMGAMPVAPEHRIESLDSLWRRREEIRRAADPRFDRDSAGGAVHRFRIDAPLREMMERARQELEQAWRMSGTVIKTASES